MLHEFADRGVQNPHFIGGHDISNGGPKPESELAGLVAPDAVGQLPPPAAPRLEVRELVQDGEGVRGAALQVRVFDAAKDDTLVCG